MVKLARREIPVVTFRRDLPAYLAGGEPAYIEVDARAGGSVNPVWTEGAEQITIRARIMDAKSEQITDPEGKVRQRHKDALAIGRDRFGLLYDACVIEWRSNILDDGKPIECTRATFMALLDERVPELARAFADLEREVTEAGRAVIEADRAIEKN